MEFEERAADPLAGGLQHGYQCGMLWGSVLAAGAQAYRVFGAGPRAMTAAMIAAQRIVESFRDQNTSINCREITGVNLLSPTTGAIARFLFKSASKGSCLGMAARCAHAAFTDIEAVLSDDHIATPDGPASCSAILAQKMGMSDMQTTMVAGLAGGIGLSGGACGALGTAIWITGLNVLNEGGKMAYKSPLVLDVIDRFTKCTGNEFRCSKIVGRKFENVGDHARYVRDEGCSTILQALANHVS